MLEEFRALVRAGVLRVTPDNEVEIAVPAAPSGPPPQAPPASEEHLRDVDKQLMEWLERSRQRRAEGAAPAPPAITALLRSQLFDRLVHKLLEAWDRFPEQDRLLSDEVIDRVAEKLLERWTRGAK